VIAASPSERGPRHQVAEGDRLVDTLLERDRAPRSRARRRAGLSRRARTGTRPAAGRRVPPVTSAGRPVGGVGDAREEDADAGGAAAPAGLSWPSTAVPVVVRSLTWAQPPRTARSATTSLIAIRLGVAPLIPPSWRQGQGLRVVCGRRVIVLR
jgi:hypothetical protein